MVCATCNSFPRQVTPVWWSYMAHIFLCLFIFPKSNHSSPYDDDVVPGIPGHPPTGLSQPFGVLCLLCLFLFTCLLYPPTLRLPLQGITTPPVADNLKVWMRSTERLKAGLARTDPRFEILENHLLLALLGKDLLDAS